MEANMEAIGLESMGLSLFQCTILYGITVLPSGIPDPEFRIRNSGAN